MIEDIRKRILELALEQGALLFGEFTLTSGQRSRYYFDGRLITLHPEGAYLVARAMLPAIIESGAALVGGPSIAADPMVSAIVTLSHMEGTPIPGFLVRPGIKEYGTQKMVEGPIRRGARVAIVDDVCTTAKSLFRAIEAAEAEGCTVVKVLAILDRRQGGSDELRQRGYEFMPLLEASPKGEVGVAATGG